MRFIQVTQYHSVDFGDAHLQVSTHGTYAVRNLSVTYYLTVNILCESENRKPPLMVHVLWYMSSGGLLDVSYLVLILL